MNLVTKETTKEQMRAEYRNYPEVKFSEFHNSRIQPIYWDIPDGVTVLDLGCNTGDFMKRLLDGKKNVTVKGIDVSEDCIAKAKERGLDVILGDGEALPYEDGTFDYVVLMEVLVHVHEPKKLLSEIKRVLKKDGTLIGSAPHKNLEMQIWDDKRMHHAYYTTEEISDLFHEFFSNVHFKVLKGGQFSVGMAGSYLGDKDVEILFKCGGDQMKDWDYKLQDKDVLRVWMGPTTVPGVVYYRMTGYADKMNKMERTDVLYSRFDYSDQSGPGSWQEAWARTVDNKPNNPVVASQMEGMLKIADLSVWGITGSFSVLAFFHALKAAYPRKPFITEMDDWIFDIPSQNLASHPYRPGSPMEKVAFEQLKLSDVIICSTQFIKDSLVQLFPGKMVYVVPNSIDFNLWDKLEKPSKTDRIRIGYSGCGNHSDDMSIVKKPILALLDEFPNVDFLLSTDFESWKDVQRDQVYRNTIWVPIDHFHEAFNGWNLDIGIAPLKDSNFNRAKSNLRWLEYSAMKIPTVASKVYPFEKSIIHGEDGFICNSQQKWYDTLKDLIQNESRRKTIGEQSYKRVKRDFNMDKVAVTYKSVLEGIKRSFK